MDGSNRELVSDVVRSITRRHVGAVVAAVQEGGRTIIEGGGRIALGSASPPGAGSVFEIGSVTKVFTAIALADAVVRGVVKLDSPVLDFLPVGSELPRDGDGTTLEQLATHTAGLPRSPFGRFAELRSQNPYTAVSDDQVLAALPRLKLRSRPGRSVSYSNVGAALLGIALRHATGSDSYEDMIRQRVCGPLGMDDTVVVPRGAQVERLVVGHRWRRRPAEPWSLSGMVAAGGLHSTAADLAGFLRAQLVPEGTPLGAALELSHVDRRPQRWMGIGLGWWRTTTKMGPVMWHNGATGGFRSFVAFVPSRGRAVAIIANSFTMRGVDAAGLRLLQGLDG